jgi:adenosylcobinamide-GDP ribazoletransferase
MLKDLLLAASFLWRIPIKVNGVTERDFQRALVFFPLIGAFEGLIVLFLAKGLKDKISAEVLSLLLLFSVFIIRGIFHLDGLGDTFDALSYKGGISPEEDKKKRLAIMKDSTTGVAGVSAVVLDILSKVLFIREILLQSHFNLLFLPYFFSRALLLPVIFFSKPARNEGLGFLMHKNLKPSGVFLGLGLSLFVLGFGFYSEKILKIYHIALILCLNLVIIIYFKRKFERAFGGLTGDNFGALVEIIEGVTLFYGGVIWPRL